MPIGERDPSAQNDGADDLQNPPVPHTPFAEGHFGPRYAEGPAGTPNGPISPANDGSYQYLNGVRGISHSYPNMPPLPAHTVVGEQEFHNGVAHSQSNYMSPHTAAAPEFKPANGEADSFSNAQVDKLNVLVREHDQPQQSVSALPATQAFTNGSIEVNGTGPSQG